VAVSPAAVSRQVMTFIECVVLCNETAAARDRAMTRSRVLSPHMSSHDSIHRKHSRCSCVARHDIEHIDNARLQQRGYAL
jgi:hypothetical protein